MSPRISVVIPAYNEGEEIGGFLDRLLAALPAEADVAVVVDFPADSTLPPARRHAGRDPRLRPMVSDYGPGPANAIRYGVDHTAGRVVVVMMADGCDDPTQVEPLARLVESGAAVAAASRYARGGRQVGARLVKRACWPGSVPGTRRTRSRPTTGHSCRRWGSTAGTVSRLGWS